MYSKYKFCPFLFPLQYIQSVTLATHGKSPADAAQFSIGASDGEQNGTELLSDYPLAGSFIFPPAFTAARRRPPASSCSLFYLIHTSFFL